MSTLLRRSRWHCCCSGITVPSFVLLTNSQNSKFSLFSELTINMSTECNSLWGGLNLGKHVPWKPDKVDLQRDPASSSVKEGMRISVGSLRSHSVLLWNSFLEFFFLTYSKKYLTYLSLSQNPRITIFLIADCRFLQIST